MKHLYAPWRTRYTRKEEPGQMKNDTCIFCQQIAQQADEHHFIIKRYEHALVILNKYPYNPGHLMVIPYHHAPSLEILASAERAELIELVSYASSVLTKSLKAQGINIGLNIGGHAAGGSMPEHLHMHVLPRWHGDTNFLATLADTKVLTLDLNEIYQQLKQAFT